MVSAFALCILLHTAQDATPRVRSAKQEASYLSLKLSKRISVSAKLENEILYISDDRDPSTELSAVVLALHASAVETPAGISIERTTTDQKKEEDAFLSWRESWLKGGLDFYQDGRSKRLKQVPLRQALLSELQAESGGEGGAIDAEQFEPAASLLEKLVLRIGVQEVAGLPDRSKTVYETHPVLGASQLPPVDDLVADYEEELKSLAGISLSLNDKQSLGDSGNAVVTLSEGDLPQPSLYRLVIEPGGGTVTFNLEIFSSDGEQVDSASLELAPHLAGTPSAPRIQSVSGKIPFDEPAKTMREWMDNALFRRKLMDWVFDPEHHDPLQPLAVFGFQRYAASDGRLIVADIPDWMLAFVYGETEDDGLDLGKFGRDLEDRGDYEKLSLSDVDVWRPRDPETVEADRAPRSRLRQIIQEVQQTQTLEPRAVAHFYRDAFPRDWTLSSFWRGVSLNLFNTFELDAPSSPATLAFMGSVSDGDWNRLEEGSSVSVDSLGATGELEAILREDAGIVTKEKDIFDGFGFVQSEGSSLFNHASERYRDAFVGSTPVWIEAKLTPFFFSSDPATGENYGWLPDSFRFAAFSRYLPKVDHPTQLDLDRLRPQFEENAKRVNVKTGEFVAEALVFGLPGGVKLVEPIPTRIRNIQSAPYADLPQAEKDAIWRSVCEKVAGKVGG